jgi:hypothetical protein
MLLTQRAATATIVAVMALGIAVVRGRGFSIGDRRDAAAVAVVSESAARLVLGGDDPIGRHIHVGTGDGRQRWAVTVGVVRDVHHYRLDDAPRPAAYLPFAQAPPVQGWASLVVRARVAPDRVDRAVRAVLVDVDRLHTWRRRSRGGRSRWRWSASAARWRS